MTVIHIVAAAADIAIKVRWVSDSVTRHLPHWYVGLRLPPRQLLLHCSTSCI